MRDLIFWIVTLLVCTGWGLPIARALPSKFAWRLALAPTFGSAILAVIVPLAYRLGAPMRAEFAVASLSALLSLGWHVRRHGAPRDHIGRELAGAWLVVGLLLLIPRFTGGDRFTVFRGNQWDTFNYLEAAVTFGEKPYAKIVSSTLPQQLRNPTFALAQNQLVNRPSVHELYALFTRIDPGRAYRLYYTFLVYFMAQLVLVGLFVIRNALPRAPPWTWLAIAAAFPLGFWGQYVLDIDAWSQVASAPLLLAMFGLALHIAAEWSARDGARLALALAIATAGSVYLYPEGLTIYAAALAPVTLGLLIAAVLRARRFEWRRLVPFAGFAGVAAAALSPDLLSLLVGQLGRSNSPANDWWTWFQRFFLGRDNVWGDGFTRAADFAAGLFGFYFVTPADDSVIHRVVIVAIIIGLVFAVVLMLRTVQPERAALVAWIATALFLLVPALFLAHKGSYWAAGKVVSFAAPVFVAALCLPLAGASKWRWFAIVYVALQLGAGLFRIPAATWDSHSGYADPYPSIHPRGLKRDLGWDLTGLEPYLDSSSKVTVHPTDVWRQHALMTFLLARKIPFVLQAPVVVGPDGPELGRMPMPWSPQIELSFPNGLEIQLDYLDHAKPSVHISTK